MELEFLLPGEGMDRIRTVPMKMENREYWATNLPEARPGMFYRFRLITDRDGRFRAPDPCSRWQPQGPNGFSVLLDPGAFDWGTEEAGWTGPEKTSDLGPICELHVGAFTDLGTFDAMDNAQLKRLVEAGYRSIQIMPVHCFPGCRNWGYDPSLLFSPAPVYGTPDQLRALVRRAHAAGLFIGLDVVYNHFGPESNFHGWFGPYMEDGRTPWGPGLSSGTKPVQEFLADNATLWINEYHFDFLRLDQSHLVDDQALIAIQNAVHASFPNGRVIAEDYGRRLRLTMPVESGGLGLSSQWNFQFHHVVMGRLCGETFHDMPHHGDAIKAVLDHGLLGWEESMPPEEVKSLEGQEGAWVNYMASHDEIGNRDGNEIGELGAERLACRIPPGAYQLGMAMAMLMPGIPMFFMGDEYAETAPFPFFADMRDPRVWPNLERSRPNALAITTFRAAKIRPQLAGEDEQKREALTWFQQLARFRRNPTIHEGRFDRIRVQRASEPEASDSVFALEFLSPEQESSRVWGIFNFSSTDYGVGLSVQPPADVNWKLALARPELPDNEQYAADSGGWALPIGPWACILFEAEHAGDGQG
jgi:maltooligosyltrehalose trehalohydrolase